MIVEGHPVAEHWGRRLMASVPDNETVEKNCSEPGMLLYEIKVALIYFSLSINEALSDYMMWKRLLIVMEQWRIITQLCSFPQLHRMV